MAGQSKKTTAAFDFSLEAQDFKERLWRRMLEDKPAPALQPLEDDDLEFLNAAGMPCCAEEEDLFR